MNEKEFNAMFDEAFENAISEIDIDIVPDYTAVWGRTRVQMRNQRARKNRLRKIQIASGIAGMILVGSIIFSLPVVSDALSPMMSRIAETRDQIVNVFTKDDETFEDGMKTAPPPDDAGAVIFKGEADRSTTRFDNKSVEKKWTSFEKYKANTVDFPLKDIKYIPENYIFTEARSFSSNTHTFYVTFMFINDQEETLSLKAELSEDTEHQVVSLDTENYIYEQETLQNGVKANIYLFNNGDIKIHMFINHLTLHLFGKVSKEEGIDFMENIVIE